MRVPWSRAGRACRPGTTGPLAFSATGAEADSGDCTKVAAPAGSDSAAGTVAAPFRTGQKLADSPSAGQTGCLRRGSYSENVEVRSGGSSSAPLRITGYPGEKAAVLGEFEVHKTAPFVVVDHVYLNGRTAGRVSPIVNPHALSFRNGGGTI